MMKTESISAQNRESLRQLRRRLVREQRAVSIRKFFRNKLSVVGMVLVLLMLICAVFAPLITGLLGVDPYTATMQERFQAPSAAHLFGTDNLGRDIFARVLYGAQISMTVGFTVGLLSALIGTALGLYASVNKVLDNVLMRLCDGLKAIPNILLAITLMAVLGANMKNVIISLTIVSIPGVARIARSQALLAREQTYAEAMTAVGASRTRILWRHILPNILSPIIVQMTFTFATAIISEASLSFLGAGIQSPYPSWGGMLNEARGYVYMGWWMIVFPAIFTALSVLGFNLFGDGLRDLEEALTFYPKMKVYAVAGNCDFGALEPLDGLAAFDQVVIFYTHGHMYGVKYDLDTLTDAAEARGAEVALFGHTHVPVAEQHGAVCLFNPGSCGRCYTGPNTYGILTLDKGRIVHHEHKEVPHP